MNRAQRLKEYGMYIRGNHEGTYNLGWTHAQRRGGFGTFPTYDDAYDAFEQVVDKFWEYHEENLQQLAESMTYHTRKKE